MAWNLSESVLNGMWGNALYPTGTSNPYQDLVWYEGEWHTRAYVMDAMAKRSTLSKMQYLVNHLPTSPPEPLPPTTNQLLLLEE